jgi:hypothetical protein
VGLDRAGERCGVDVCWGSVELRGRLDPIGRRGAAVANAAERRVVTGEAGWHGAMDPLEQSGQALWTARSGLSRAFHDLLEAEKQRVVGSSYITDV